MKIQEHLGTLIPIGSTLVIFASAIKHVVVYAAFDIPILRYISFTDLFLMILYDVILITTIAIFVSVFPIALEGKPIKVNDEVFEKPPTKPVFAWMTTFLLCFILIQVFAKNINYGLTAWTFAILLFISVIFFLYIKGKVLKSVRNIFIYFFILYSIVLLMGAVAFRDIYSIKVSDAHHIRTFIFEDKTITTDKNLIYVGKTMDFIFLYNKEKEMSRIIKIDHLVESTLTAAED